MNDLIERKALIDNIYNIKQTWSMDKDDYIDEMMNCIYNAPKAEAKKVVHARWIFMDSYDAHKNPIYLCTNCQKTVADYYINKHKFCLHCGAEMDGVSK